MLFALFLFILDLTLMEPMKLEVVEHEGKEQAGATMYAVCRDYWPDLRDVLCWDFPRFFSHVSHIPYMADDELFPARVIEILSRPAYLLDRGILPRLDCKKKSILLGAWAKGNYLPFRFVAVSHKTNREIHHVFPQIDFGWGWINCDATFPEFSIGDPQPATYAEVLTP